ncbi:hypothetical protein L3X38_016355 [Prunus dulcis]|uniref:Ty3-gypsy retrotransposon protein n=1 Tax=Prunus dulcis TaxID=3755 RepID=A0AAD4Z921_PRUDU|nr:hypothetical protein L3X38_016355 [Prunus dulcis]
MASKIQSVPATRGKSVSTSFSSGDSAGVVTQSKAEAISVTRHVTSIPTQAKGKDVNRRREPVINLAKKTIARADERNSSNEEKSFSCLKNSRERSLSLVSDADSSTGSYHRSPPENQQKKIASASVGESYSMTMQVMVTGAMSIKEQLAYMSEAVTKLMKMVEEKDVQIASLINQWETHQDKEPSQDVHKKESHHEAESSEKGLGHETESGDKSHGKGDTALMGSLSIQQLQDMITNTIRAQYGGPSQDTFIYSKPYTKRLDNLRMSTGYQPPKFMQFDGKGNPKQHVAHFIEMCNIAGTNDDYLMKQFIRSLRGTAFN